MKADLSNQDVALSLLLFVASIALSMMPGPRTPKRKDILGSILEETAPVAASKELSSLQASLTCERLIDGKKIIITKDPQVADYIFNGKHRKNYIRRPANNAGLQQLGMFQRGLIWNNDCEQWAKIRECFKNALSDTTIQTAVKVVKQEAVAILEYAHGKANGEPVNMLEITRKLTFRATLNVFFGIESSDFDAMNVEEKDFINAIVAYFKAWEFFLLRPKRRWDSLETRRHSEAVMTLKSHVSKMLLALDARKTSPSRKLLFIDYLRDACGCGSEDDARMHLEQGALEMLLAGTDTSSVTAYYALLGLAGDSDLQSDLRTALAASKDNGKRSLPLLDSVVDETLRFKPVGPVVLREAVADDPSFPEGIAVDSGTAILIHLAEMNLCEDLWQDAGTFSPRRFLDLTDKDKKFFPFGKGPKGCIGMFLGRAEVNAIIDVIVGNYDMELEGLESLASLQTHWDIANQPDRPIGIRIMKIKVGC